jgi:hypothetical protein
MERQPRSGSCVLHHEHLTSLLGPRQYFQSSVTSSVMLGNNFVSVTKTSVLIVPERTMNVTLTTATVATTTTYRIDLAQPPFARDLSRQEPSPLRFQPTFADPDITTSVLTKVAEPTKNAKQATTEEPTTSTLQPATRLSQPNSASKNPAKYDFN